MKLCGGQFTRFKLAALAALIITTQIIAASIGNSTYGDDGPASLNKMSGSRFQATSSFTAGKMRAYVMMGSGNISMAIYSDSTGATGAQPGHKLGQTNSMSVTADAWDTISLTTSVLLSNGVYYWLLFNTNNNSIVLGIDAGVGLSKTKNQTFGTWPTSFGAVLEDFGDQYAIQTFSVGGTAPTISAQPGNVTGCEGTSANFSLTALGTAPLTYQWVKNSIDIIGATSSSYSIPSISVTNYQNAQIQCKVSNASGTVTSNAGVITVKTTPVITSAPANLTVKAGDIATFSVSVSGTAPFTYQWMRKSVNVTGATSSTYKFVSQVADTNATYSCNVSNSCGSVTSSTAKLTVNVPQPPTIVTQPANQSVIEGGRGIFSVSVAGTQPFSYQWKRNGTAVSGAISPSCTTEIVTIALDSGKGYSCVIANSVGSITSNTAILNVVATKPVVTLEPSNKSVYEGETVIFETEATGSVPLSFQWRKRNIPVAGATQKTVTLPSVVLTDDSATFDCIVTNAGGADTTRKALLRVEPRPLAPQITFHPMSTIGAVGDSARFLVHASGTMPLHYQWYTSTGPIAGATDTLLIVGALSLSDNDKQFRCLVYNMVDTAISRYASLLVKRPSSQQVVVTGELYDRQGSPIGYDKAVTMDFVARLYPSISSDSAVYTESFTQANNQGVIVSGGKFAMRLGEGTTTSDLSLVVTTYPNLFVSFIVMRPGGNPEVLEPRTPLTASPYALSAKPEVLHGKVSPVSVGLTSPVGTHYVDDVTRKTYIKTNNSWVELKE